MFNEASMKTLVEYMSKEAELLAKHGVTLVGSWGVSTEHLVVQVFEAPSFEAFQAYGMEPEVMVMSNWQTQEIKSAMPPEEFGQMMQQMQQK
jgi:hypothetical protein